MTQQQNPIEKILDKDSAVKDLMAKFGMSEHQATVAFLVSCGDNIYDACERVYAVHQRTEAGKLVSMQKFRDALNYLSGASFIEERLAGLKLFLLSHGVDKMVKFKNENAYVGLWKTLVGLSFEDKLPDGGAGLAKKLEDLATHFAESDKAKEQIISNTAKAKKEEEFVQ